MDGLLTEKKMRKLNKKFLAKARVYANFGPPYVFMIMAGRIHAVRVFFQWLARLRHPMRPDLHTGAISSTVELDPEIGVRSLKQHGVSTGLKLKEEVHSELRESLLSRACHGAGDLRYPFLYGDKREAERRYGQRFLQGHYYGIAIPGSPALRVAADPGLNRVLREYCGTDLRLVGVRAWWSFVCQASPQERLNAAQQFHYDVDDYMALSVFFYLSDVDASAGPHIAVRGSHKKKKLHHIWSLSRCRSDDEILQTYGSENVQMICGQSGTGFIEDTFCFHKGQEPMGRDRLVFQLRYALHDYGTGADSAHREWLTADRVPARVSAARA